MWCRGLEGTGHRLFQGLLLIGFIEGGIQTESGGHETYQREQDREGEQGPAGLFLISISHGLE